MEWQPIETAPKDGTPVLLGSWYLGPDLATAAWNGLFWDMRHLDGDDAQSAALDRFNREFGSPESWLPLDALPPPPVEGA